MSCLIGSSTRNLAPCISRCTASRGCRPRYAIARVLFDELRERAVSDDRKWVIDIFPSPKKDVDAFMLIQAADEQTSVAPRNVEIGRSRSAIRFDENAFRWEAS